MSYYKVDLGSTSKDIALGVLRIISNGRKYLTRWAKAFLRNFPDHEYDILPAKDLTIVNGKKVALMTNTCN